MYASFFRRHADGLALVALALVCAVVFWPLWHGQSYYIGDLQLYFQPMATQWKAALDGGVIPLWNSGILGGTPFVGNPQMWVLYPASLLFLAFPAVQALALSTLLHFWLGGAFFYGWTRRGQLNLHPSAAFLGACVWMLCGYVVAKLEFPNMFMAIAWLPAVLWAGEAVVRRNNGQSDGRSLLVLGLMLALQMATAHAQISLMSFYLLGAYSLLLWRTPPPEIASQRARGWRGSGWRVAALFGLAFVLMGLLTLGQTLPVLETLQAAARQKLTVYDASRFALLPWTIIVVVLPYFYGNPMTNDWHYPFKINLWESVCYIGLVPLILGGIAVWRQKTARFWLGWSLIHLWLAMGVFGGLWVVAFYLLPGVNRFHDAGRFLMGFSLGGAVLAAMGAHWLWTKARYGRNWTLVALGLVLLDLGGFAHKFHPMWPQSFVATAPPVLWGDDDMVANRQARLWQVDQEPMWNTLQEYDKWRPDDRENTLHLYETGIYNRHTMNGWMSEGGYEPLFDRATRQRFGTLPFNAKNTSFDPRLAERMARLSIRSLQLFRPDPVPETPDLKLIYTSPWEAQGHRLYFYRNEKCLPRARFRTADPQTVGSGVDSQSARFGAEPQGVNSNWQMARIVRETTRSIQLEVPANARVVELADSMRPGWSATVDGQPIPIETTVENWRLLRLPPTAPTTAATAPMNPPESAMRRVDFEYAPMPWKVGVFVSLCALGFVSAGLAATRRR